MEPPFQTQGDPGQALTSYIPITVKPLIERKTILLATVIITEDNVFANGLFQNVFVLYRMFDAMGHAPILFVNTKPLSLENIPEVIRKCRMITVGDLMRDPIKNLLGMIEIGMSFDASVRQMIRSLGGRRWKLYLGNILNIDIETPMFYPTNYFPHHVVDELDSILVSPHYAQHAEYASYINHVQQKEGLIAPYVWDPVFVDRAAPIRWEPGPEVLIIMEPNISFQKTAIVPLLIAKAAGRHAFVINGDRLKQIPHFVENILPHLGTVEFLPRMDIRSVMQCWPSATFILHNVNNEFNYMTLELLWAGFPVIHNSPSWASFGYSYSGADIAGAVERLGQTATHAERKETYAAHAATIAWRYSPYNPVNQAAWDTILRG